MRWLDGITDLMDVSLSVYVEDKSEKEDSVKVDVQVFDRRLCEGVAFY